MEFLYEVGQCKHFKESNNLITIYSLAIKLNRDIIGSYIDCHGIVKRIRRESSWGKKIIELLAIPVQKPSKRGEDGLQKAKFTLPPQAPWVSS